MRDNAHFSRAPRPVARLALAVALERALAPLAAREADPGVAAARSKRRQSPATGVATGRAHGFEAWDPARARQRPGFSQVFRIVPGSRGGGPPGVAPEDRRHPTPPSPRANHRAIATSLAAASATPARSPRDFMPGVAMVSRRWEVQGSMARSRAPRRGFRDSKRSRGA